MTHPVAYWNNDKPGKNPGETVMRFTIWDGGHAFHFVWITVTDAWLTSEGSLNDLKGMALNAYRALHGTE